MKLRRMPGASLFGVARHAGEIKHVSRYLADGVGPFVPHLLASTLYPNVIGI